MLFINIQQVLHEVNKLYRRFISCWRVDDVIDSRYFCSEAKQYGTHSGLQGLGVL